MENVPVYFLLLSYGYLYHITPLSLTSILLYYLIYSVYILRVICRENMRQVISKLYV